MKEYDIVIIGGGMAGMTASIVPLQNNINKILIIEREQNLGGILNQCISNIYGKKLLGAELTGPEYISFMETQIKQVEKKLGTEVLEISDDKVITYVNPKEGVNKIKGKTIILATGCREKLTGSIDIPLNKFSGIYTIGNAQKTINLEGHLPGKNCVVVANSNWALSLVRRLILEGSKIRAVIIKEDNGFKINEYFTEVFKQFDVNVIHDYKIKEIYGKNRIDGIKVVSRDKKKEYVISCDSLILSVAYIPEISITKKTSIQVANDKYMLKLNKYETSIKGIFACGNMIYGMDALKYKDIDGLEAGRSAVEYLESLN